jgi:hypothetical protein
VKVRVNYRDVKIKVKRVCGGRGGRLRGSDDVCGGSFAAVSGGAYHRRVNSSTRTGI